MFSLSLEGSEIPREWFSLLDNLQNGRIILVLGGSDTGKTTFIKFLINEFIKRQKKVAFIDSDIGQSSIGVPTTIGSALISSIEDIKSPRLNSLFFIGSTSPPGNLLQMAVGLKRIVETALCSRPDLTIIDTTGFIYSHAGYELKYQKASLVQPTHIVAIQREKEIEPLLRLITYSIENTRVIRLKIVSAVKPRSLDERQANRERRFAEYFTNAKKVRIKLSGVALRRGHFGSGTPVSDLKLYELSKVCGLDILYGEEGRDEAIFITRSMGHTEGTAQRIQSYLKKDFVKILNKSELEGVIVGLGNKEDFILGLGITTEIDEGIIEVLTPLKDTPKIRIIIFGSLKLEPSGKEVGKVFID